MTQKVLADVLMKYGRADRQDDLLRLASDTTVSLFVSVGEETLNIHRVNALELLHDVLVIHTSRQERYVVVYEDVRAIHFGAPNSKPGLV